MSLPEIPGWLRGSEMGVQIFAHDWAESGLGPIENWPPHLQLAVNIILLLPSAAILLWGPEFIQIYNDPSAIRWAQAARRPWPAGTRVLAGGLGFYRSHHRRRHDARRVPPVR